MVFLNENATWPVTRRVAQKRALGRLRRIYLRKFDVLSTYVRIVKFY